MWMLGLKGQQTASHSPLFVFSFSVQLGCNDVVLFWRIQKMLQTTSNAIRQQVMNHEGKTLICTEVTKDSNNQPKIQPSQRSFAIFRRTGAANHFSAAFSAQMTVAGKFSPRGAAGSGGKTPCQLPLLGVFFSISSMDASGLGQGSYGSWKTWKFLKCTNFNFQDWGQFNKLSASVIYKCCYCFETLKQWLHL